MSPVWGWGDPPISPASECQKLFYAASNGLWKPFESVLGQYTYCGSTLAFGQTSSLQVHNVIWTIWNLSWGVPYQMVAINMSMSSSDDSFKSLLRKAVRAMCDMPFAIMSDLIPSVSCWAIVKLFVSRGSILMKCYVHVEHKTMTVVFYKINLISILLHRMCVHIINKGINVHDLTPEQDKCHTWALTNTLFAQVYFRRLKTDFPPCKQVLLNSTSF